MPSSGEEWEHPCPLYLRLAQELAELLEFGFALAGQSGYEARPEHYPRYALAQPFEQRPYARARIPPVHAFEDAVVYVLDRYIDVFDYLLLRGDDLYEFFVQLVGVEVVQAYPAQAVDLAELAQEHGKARLPIDVEAVMRQVLGDQDELLIPPLRQSAGLFEYLFHGPRAEAAANLRDEAVGAVVVAAVCYEQIGPYLPRVLTIRPSQTPPRSCRL